MLRAKVMLGACLVLWTGHTAACGPGLDWLAGKWCSNDQGRQVDEVWLPAAGGELLGMSRTLQDGKVETFEYMRIVFKGKDATLHVQPNGAPPTLFSQAASGDGWIQFENSAHDFPNRIEYRRDGDQLHAFIAGPGRDGKELKIPFDYRRCGE